MLYWTRKFALFHLSRTRLKYDAISVSKFLAIAEFDFSHHFIILEIAKFDFSDGYIIKAIAEFDFSNRYIILAISAMAQHFSVRRI